VCLYNIDRLRAQSDMLDKAGIVNICIFGSTPQNIQKYANSDLNNGTLALSDKKGFVYKLFHFAKTRGAFFGGLYLSYTIFADIRKYGKYIQVVGAVKDVVNVDAGKMARLPADFLIGEDGTIVDLFRATKIPDQMPFERVEAFIPEDKRCKCNMETCISPRCRERHVQMLKQAEAFLHTGD